MLTARGPPWLQRYHLSPSRFCCRAEKSTRKAGALRSTQRRAPLRIDLKADALIIAQREMRLGTRTMHAVIAADGHVARLQQHMVPQGEARFKAAVGAEIELQQALLRAKLRIGLHLEPHQHGAHAVQPRIAVDLAVSVRLRKAAALPGPVRRRRSAVVVDDVDTASLLSALLPSDRAGTPGAFR